MDRTSRFVISFFITAALAAQNGSPDTAIRGFSAQSAAAEHELEKKFAAIPQPDRLREYMKTISEEPHHAGSPNSRKVAEYILGKFKEWSLDARIEEFEALMPTPKERAVEMIEPTHYRLQLKE